MIQKSFLFGSGSSVLLLHGGLANSNYWGNQIKPLAEKFCVTVMDTRGHGRSTLHSGSFSYALFARDVIGLLDHLRIDQTSIIGWSDGGITALQLAMNYPARVSKLFVFGANSSVDGLKAGGAKSYVFSMFLNRSRREYYQLSPNPEKWPQLIKA
jgi:pimeloyl-ACP methyl ester carboxylesterase